jgi:hypothetical protein
LDLRQPPLTSEKLEFQGIVTGIRIFEPKPRSKQKDVTSCRFCGRFSAAAADELAKVKEAAAACLLPASFEPHITLRNIF